QNRASLAGSRNSTSGYSSPISKRHTVESSQLCPCHRKSTGAHRVDPFRKAAGGGRPRRLGFGGRGGFGSSCGGFPPPREAAGAGCSSFVVLPRVPVSGVCSGQCGFGHAVRRGAFGDG